MVHLLRREHVASGQGAPVTWIAARVEAATPLHDVLELRPELAELLDDYLAAVWHAADPVLLELCRLRIATVHGDTAQQRLRHDTAMAAGLTEEKVAALPGYATSPLFTDHERTCIAYAEQYVIDVHGITDADAEAVKRGMSDADFVAFTVALGLFDGLGRLRLVLGVDEPTTDEPVTVPTPGPGHHAH
jgi:alkylhydroperoxidase family enzyme